MEISKEILVSMGGNLWEKGSLSRVYVNDEILKKLGFNIVDVARYANEFRGLGKEKLYYDNVKNCFIADSGTTRTAMKNNGFKCA